MEKGAPGATCKQPVLPPECEGYNDNDWAKWFLKKGGFGDAMQVDEDGWTPLMHAIQSSVHWDKGCRCCLGLIEMMEDSRWLRATATRGRMKGYNALHMACTGSDRAMMREQVVERLIARGVDLDATNGDAGVTAWLLAAGTGVVNVAKLLAMNGCDIHAKCPHGRNAADRCCGSSSEMRRYRRAQ